MRTSTLFHRCIMEVPIGLRLLAAVVVAFPAVSVHAADYRREKIDADKLIEACWDISASERGMDGSHATTASMASGHNKTLICLENTAVDQAKAFKFKIGPEGFRKSLEAGGKAILKVYEPIYHDGESCREGCGTQVPVLMYAPYQRYVEGVIRDLVIFRNLKGF